MDRPPTWRRPGPPPTAADPVVHPARGTAGTAGSPAHARSVRPLSSPRVANAGNETPEGQEQQSRGGSGGTRKTRAVPPLGPPPPRHGETPIPRTVRPTAHSAPRRGPWREARRGPGWRGVGNLRLPLRFGLRPQGPCRVGTGESGLVLSEEGNPAGLSSSMDCSMPGLPVHSQSRPDPSSR